MRAYTLGAIAYTIGKCIARIHITNTGRAARYGNELSEKLSCTNRVCGSVALIYFQQQLNGRVIDMFRYYLARMVDNIRLIGTLAHVLVALILYAYLMDKMEDRNYD